MTTLATPGALPLAAPEGLPGLPGGLPAGLVPPQPATDPADPAGPAGPGTPATAEDRKAARAAARAARAAARAVAPERDPRFAHLDLAALRAHRAALQGEEDTVSYWRRLLQARLDAVRLGLADEQDRVPFRSALVTQGSRPGRTALVSVLPVDDVPPLPDLQELWDSEVGEADAAAREGLAARLEQAEAQLSAYRSLLHQQLDAATRELIARYREDPLACLVALPA